MRMTPPPWSGVVRTRSADKGGGYPGLLTYYPLWLVLGHFWPLSAVFFLAILAHFGSFVATFATFGIAEEARKLQVKRGRRQWPKKVNSGPKWSRCTQSGQKQPKQPWQPKMVKRSQLWPKVPESSRSSQKWAKSSQRWPKPAPPPKESQKDEAQGGSQKWAKTVEMVKRAQRVAKCSQNMGNVAKSIKMGGTRLEAANWGNIGKNVKSDRNFCK